MNTLNQKYERYLMFMNEPILQAGFEENDMEIRERIAHVQLQHQESENKSMSFLPRQKQLLSAIPNINNDVSANELRNILAKVDDMEKRITQISQDAEKFNERIDDEIDQVYDEDDAVNKVVKDLQEKFHNISGLYENIEQKRQYLQTAVSSLDQSKKLNEENAILRVQLAKMVEEKKALDQEKPILTKEELKQLEKEVNELKDQNKVLHQKLKEEQNQNKHLHHLNDSLVAERKTLMTKITFAKDESSLLKSEMDELSQEKMTIEKRIFESNETIDSYKNGKGPLQKLKQQTDNIQNEEIKRLMFQNEKLIQELNQLRRISVTLSPEKIKRGDSRDIFQLNKKSYDLDKENRDKECQVRMLLQQLENEKAINADLNKSFKTLEHRYNQLQNEYNSLKQNKSSGNNTFRIFSEATPRQNPIINSENSVQAQQSDRVFHTPQTVSTLSPNINFSYKPELETPSLFQRLDGKTIGNPLFEIGNKF